MLATGPLPRIGSWPPGCWCVGRALRPVRTAVIAGEGRSFSCFDESAYDQAERNRHQKPASEESQGLHRVLLPDLNWRRLRSWCRTGLTLRGHIGSLARAESRSPPRSPGLSDRDERHPGPAGTHQRRSRDNHASAHQSDVRADLVRSTCRGVAPCGRLGARATTDCCRRGCSGLAAQFFAQRPGYRSPRYRRGTRLPLESAPGFRPGLDVAGRPARAERVGRGHPHL